MYQVDKDDLSTMEEYKQFAKYYSSQLGNECGILSHDLKDLF